jgi:hypothetical protein
VSAWNAVAKMPNTYPLLSRAETGTRNTCSQRRANRGFVYAEPTNTLQ